MLTCASLAAAQRSVTASSTAATTVVFGAVADARVLQENPASNYGSSSTLRTELGASDAVESFLRFSVVGLSGSVQRALLRVYAYNGTVDGPAVYGAESSWSESAITWNSRPALTSGVVADVGALSSAGSWAEWDVTSLVAGNGTFSFAVRPTSSDGVDFYSRQSGNTSLRPQLVVETATDGPPVTTSPPAISGQAQAGQTLTATTGTWSGTLPIGHAFQWQRCNSSGTGCNARTGEIAQTYGVTSADVGSTLRVVVTATNSAGSGSAASAPTGVVAAAPPPGDPVIVSAGDIAGCDYSEDEQTAQLVDAIRPTRVVTLGDHAYENGTSSEFANCYHPTWGRHKAITTPSAGNHEYNTPGATGYYGYFGAAAGDPTRGFYAYDLGAWRLYALNSNCAFVSCAAGSVQEQWLRADLAANPRQCRLAFMHHPRYSSGDTSDRRSNPSVGPLYQTFYDASGDVFLVAHNHFYERLARLAPNGSVDLQRGVRNFIVGTGGRFLYEFGAPITGSQVRHNGSHGVLELTLKATSYSWRFVSVAGGATVDSGSDTCEGASPDTTPPSAPTQLAAGVVSSTRVDLTWTASTDDVGVVAYDVYRNGALRTTTTGTTFSDTTVVAGTTYSYVVRARDAAANVSPPSNTATVTPGAAATVVFGAAADARVLEASPGSNFGSSSSLRTELDPGDSTESFLRFSVSGLSGSVRRAVLRVYAFNATADGPAVYRSGSTWSESAITWGTRPGLTSGVVADVGALPSGSWGEWDVTSLVSGPGEVSFALRPTSGDGVDFYSRQASNTALRPQLVIETG